MKPKYYLQNEYTTLLTSLASALHSSKLNVSLCRSTTALSKQRGVAASVGTKGGEAPGPSTALRVMPAQAEI